MALSRILGALAALLATLALASPSAAQSYYFAPAATAGQNANLNNSYEVTGIGADGQMTLVGTNTAHTKTTTPVQLSAGGSGGVTVSAWAGMRLYLGFASTGAARYLVDISFNNGSTWAIQNLYVEPSAGQTPVRYDIPLNVPAGSTVVARAQSSTTNATLRVGIVGIVRNAASPPLFSSMVTIGPDTASTRASASDINGVASGSTTWAALVNSTATAYGALLAVPGSGTTTSAPDVGMLRLATGVALSETEIIRAPVQYASTAPVLSRAVIPTIERTIPANERLSVQFVRPTTTETMRMALYGFVP